MPNRITYATSLLILAVVTDPCLAQDARTYVQTPVTHTGMAGRPAISADTRYIAYVLREASGYSLWLHSSDTCDVRMVAAEPGVVLRGVAFTPDGEVDFVRVAADKSAALWRVGTNGLGPRKIIDDVASVPTWSPRGDQVAFLRRGVDGTDQLIVAGGDGGFPRTVLTNIPATRLLSFGNSARVIAPAWSRDGRRIAVLASTDGASRIIVLDPGTGAIRIVDPEMGANATGLVWLDETSLVGGFQRKPGSPRQLWRIPFPAGEPTRISADSDNYDGISISDTGVMVTTRSRAKSSIWVANGDGSSPIETVTNLSEVAPAVAWNGTNVVYGASAKGLTVSKGRSSPDERTVATLDVTGTNIITRPAIGGDARPVTHFTDGLLIGMFQWSADGKKLALSRWSVSNDVVLVK